MTNCSCGKKLRVKAQLIGKKVKCPSCGAIVVVESPGTSEPRKNAPLSSSPTKARLERMSDEIDQLHEPTDLIARTMFSLVKAQGKLLTVALTVEGAPEEKLKAYQTCKSALAQSAAMLGPKHPAIVRILKMQAIVDAHMEGRPEPTDAELKKRFEGGGCFIATAACGTDRAGDVIRLQEFRETVLRQTPWGAAFISLYESLSPSLASVIARSPRMRRVVRELIVRPARCVADACLRAGSPSCDGLGATHWPPDPRVRGSWLQY